MSRRCSLLQGLEGAQGLEGTDEQQLGYGTDLSPLYRSGRRARLARKLGGFTGGSQAVYGWR